MSDTYYWDFFGPDAEQTAAHFKRHLDGFLERNGCVGCTTGTCSEGEGHCAAWCRAPRDQGEAIARALRPRRSESTTE